MTRRLSAVLNRANADYMSLPEPSDNHNLQRAASICQHSTVEQYIPNEDRWAPEISMLVNQGAQGRQQADANLYIRHI